MTELGRIQSEALALLVAFDRICRRHSIAYQLAAGTLLGAVRHGGFIPWDDDIDVCLRREAYERFLTVAWQEFAPDGLAPTCRLQHRGTDPDCGFLFCKMERSRAPGRVSGAFIDIFPFDGVRRAPLRGRLHMRGAYLAMAMLAYGQKGAPAQRRPSSAVRRWARRALGWLAVRQCPNRLAERLETLARWYEGRPTGHLACLVAGRMRYRQMRAARDFDDCIEMAFEGHRFPVPRAYDEVLRNLYGDWRTLPPARERRPHHDITGADRP
ncbi:LicD family protein [Ancylobacter sp.]|uniref:LicD family protein n=1 Tax=Ancylobacter sp. TaxID=1872567 RepID=UPI003D12CD40